MLSCTNFGFACRSLYRRAAVVVPQKTRMEEIRRNSQENSRKLVSIVEPDVRERLS